MQSTLEIYLKKIGHISQPETSLECLSQLQFLHLCHFPFENINSFLGIPVCLDKESLHQKFLFENRGGYCFEQNLFFMEMLKTIGFQVRPLLARVHHEDHILGRTHLCLLVSIGNKNYIADVGFGGLASPQPLVLETENIQNTRFENYRFQQSGTNYFLQIELNSDWKILYSFDLVDYFFPDIEIANWYISTHPKSHFTTSLMLSFMNDDTRYSMMNNQFSIYKNGHQAIKKNLSNYQQVQEILESIFKLSLKNLPGFQLKISSLFIESRS